jgi:tetratricopeptide (TPR) repeat protein
VELIFHEVLDAPEDQRPSILEVQCHGDPALTTEVLSLLEACEAERALASRWSIHAATAADTAQPIRWIGPYQLDRLLGRGGMGAVHLAHRVDGQFQQQVAVKLIDLPLASALFRERFRQERQILAGLVHPYIARLLDGGVSEDGELYLVMEYVDGVSIERHCRVNQLPIRDRLLLFQKVCAAVQFAHQNLIVHRDLKSDNILVLKDGTPKLLDFGTAKLMAPVPDVHTTTEFTRLGMQAFTPSYASPEQVLGEPITTASDTYSLGVLLYLLLAEVLPYELKECTTVEMLRVICTEPPPKPSTVAYPQQRLDADLDAIVLKALRKEPAERYRSVDEFALDIQAYLEGRPVQARRGDLRYRALKFARRNRLALGAAGLVFASLVAGLAGVLWQFRVATVERRRAEARSRDMRQLSQSLLSEIDEAVKQLPGSTPVRRLLVERVLEHLDSMAKDAAGDRQTRLDLVNAYMRLGNLQGNPYDQNIGDPDGALISLDKALVIARALNAGKPGNPGVLGSLALAEQSRSEVLFGVGRTQESIASMRAAVDAFNARIAGPGPSAAQIAEAASAYGSLGDQLGQSGVASLGDPEGAIQAYRKGLELSLQSLQADPGFTRSRRAVAIDHYKIGNIQVETNPLEAIEEYRLSLAAWNALTASDKSSAAAQRGIATTSRKLGMAFAAARDSRQALAAFEQARGTYESFAAADPKDARAQYDLSIELSNEADVYLDLLDPDLNPNRDKDKEHARAVIELLDRSAGILQRLVAIDPKNEGWVMNLAHYQVVSGTLRLGQSGGAGRAASVAPELAAMVAGASKADASLPTLDHATSALLTVLPGRLRKPEQAVQFAERMVTQTRRRKPAFILSLAQAYRSAGHAEKARATAREGLALLPAPKPGASKPRLRRLLEVEAS